MMTSIFFSMEDQINYFGKKTTSMSSEDGITKMQPKRIKIKWLWHCSGYPIVSLIPHLHFWCFTLTWYLSHYFHIPITLFTCFFLMFIWSESTSSKWLWKMSIQVLFQPSLIHSLTKILSLSFCLSLLLFLPLT